MQKEYKRRSAKDGSRSMALKWMQLSVQLAQLEAG